MPELPRFLRRRRPMFPFAVTALKQGQAPIRVGVLASSEADALEVGREMFPDHIVAAMALPVQWQEGMA